ncbi:hypothetical protein GCM10010109_49220 [Actinoplanes campanulatus]|nr:hypothetical protein GCM10010109_49220 [Actinoplanes campanulatus]GID37109.1 hypothetical protein Aca09nite_36150 [Actinoplanes campanulatus]
MREGESAEPFPEMESTLSGASPYVIWFVVIAHLSLDICPMEIRLGSASGWVCPVETGNQHGFTLQDRR